MLLAPSQTCEREGAREQKPLSESSSALGGARSAPLPVAPGGHRTAAPLRRRTPSLSTPHRLPEVPPRGKSLLKTKYKYLGSFPPEQTRRGDSCGVSWCGIISRGAVGKKIQPLGNSLGCGGSGCYRVLYTNFAELFPAWQRCAPSCQDSWALQANPPAAGWLHGEDQPWSTRFWVPFGKGCSSPADLQPQISPCWGPAQLSQLRLGAHSHTDSGGLLETCSPSEGAEDGHKPEIPPSVAVRWKRNFHGKNRRGSAGLPASAPTGNSSRVCQKPRLGGGSGGRMLPLPGHGLEAGFIRGQKPASVCAQRVKGRGEGAGGEGWAPLGERCHSAAA